MNLVEVNITKIHSEEELQRTVCVRIDTDCYGGKETKTVGFLKRDWRTIKRRMWFTDNQPLDAHGIEYMEQMSDDEWYQRNYATHLKDFTDEEIVEEFNRRLNDRLFHKIGIRGEAVIQERM